MTFFDSVHWPTVVTAVGVMLLLHIVLGFVFRKV